MTSNNPYFGLSQSPQDIIAAQRNVPGIIGTAEKRVPEIPTAIEKLNASVSYTLDRLELLRDRLTPVLTQKPMNPNKTEAPRYNSTLGQQLDELANRVSIIHSVIDDLLGSLEL